MHIYLLFHQINFLFIIVMTKIQENIRCPVPQLLSSRQNKRSIKLSHHHKFPLDFFSDNQVLLHRQYQPTPNLKKSIIKSYPRVAPQTQHEDRSSLFRVSQASQISTTINLSDIKRKKIGTSLGHRNVYIQDDLEQELIQSVLISARQIKNMIKKHSIQLKKNQNRKQDLELPPLKLKRGYTTSS